MRSPLVGVDGAATRDAVSLSSWFPYSRPTLDAAEGATRIAEQLSYHRVWLGQSNGGAPMLDIAILAREFNRIKFGTAVTLMHLMHPIQAAMDARSLSAFTGGHFVLGLGVGDRNFVEGHLGMRYNDPHEYAREYIAIVKALLDEGTVDHDGHHFLARAEFPRLPGRQDARVMLGALSKRMATVAGAVSDGCITIFAPPHYIAEVTAPAVRAGAESAGREPPPIIAIVPCAATTDEDVALTTARRAFGIHVRRPHYAKMLERAGVFQPGSERAVTKDVMNSVLVWGDEDKFAAAFDQYRQAGVAELAIAAYFIGDDPRRLFAKTSRVAASAAATLNAP